jgi:hypothetical protein
MRSIGFALLAGFAAAACMAPPPQQRVANVAREVNLAARFGRMDLALESTAPGTRRHFTAHRSQWGGIIRVLDMELAGLSMQDSEHAVVLVDFQWARLDENTMRSTRIEQTWRGGSEDRGWVLVRERRLAGDIGLFGERVPHPEPAEPNRDVQFATKTIR